MTIKRMTSGRTCPVCDWTFEKSWPRISGVKLLAPEIIVAIMDAHWAEVERRLDEHLRAHVEAITS